MAILLFVLKLIGIILLILLGLVLTAVLLVLFVPVRYQVWGQIEEKVTVHAKVTWLLHIISFVLDFKDGELASELRILGINKKPKSKNALYEEPEEEEWQTDDDGLTVVESQNDTVTATVSQEVQVNKENREKSESPMEHKASFFTKIKVKIRTKTEAFINRLRKIKDAVLQILSKASSLKAAITDESNQFVVGQVLSEFKYLLSHFKFRRLVTDLRFSTGDPATTGQALGVLCLFPVLYQYQVQIVPDFESEAFYVKGTFDSKGHVRGFHVAKSLIRLIRQKEVRIFIKKITDR